MQPLRLCPSRQPPLRQVDRRKRHAALRCDGLNSFPSENRNQAPDSFPKLLLGPDQTDDQVTVRWEIVEMAWMNVNSLFLEQSECDLFVSTRRRHAKHGVPAAFDFTATATFLRCELPVEFGEIASDS